MAIIAIAALLRIRCWVAEKTVKMPASSCANEDSSKITNNNDNANNNNSNNVNRTSSDRITDTVHDEEDKQNQNNFGCIPKNDCISKIDDNNKSGNKKEEEDRIEESESSKGRSTTDLAKKYIINSDNLRDFNSTQTTTSDTKQTQKECVNNVSFMFGNTSSSPNAESIQRTLRNLQSNSNQVESTNNQNPFTSSEPTMLAYSPVNISNSGNSSIDPHAINQNEMTAGEITRTNSQPNFNSIISSNTNRINQNQSDNESNASEDSEHPSLIPTNEEESNK
ncbi:hypothetical protein WA158_007749 [Blastocystis sp. Blastoise]